jgi:hypothetical protein
VVELGLVEGVGVGVGAEELVLAGAVVVVVVVVGPKGCNLGTVVQLY